MTTIQTKHIEQFTQAELFQKMNAICSVVNEAIDAYELLRVSLHKTMDLFGAQRGSIFIVKENTKDLVLAVAEGLALSEEAKLIKRIGEGVVGKVAEIKKPIVVEDISRDQRFRDHKTYPSYRTPSFICAPLLVKDLLIGVINIADKETGSGFNENELQLLDFLSTQIALNFRRIELYQKFKTLLKESQSLKDELGKSSRETHHLKEKIVVQEKLASIGKLAGGIAHEFNNPLDGVMRYTNLCLEHSKDSEVCDLCRGYLLEIKGGLNRMATIVKNLLACSRTTSPTMQMIHPGNVIEQVIRASHADIMAKGVTVDFSMDKNLPDILDLGFERVIINLLRNAVDAVGENGKIFISCVRDVSSLVIKVMDNGCGIAPDSLERIFEPFYTTKDIAKGCGLGLTIVDEIVKSYNGRIHVESQTQKGTTFMVTLPIG